MSHSSTHRTAALRLSEKPNSLTGATAPLTGGPKQTTISSHMKKISQRQHDQIG